MVEGPIPAWRETHRRTRDFLRLFYDVLREGRIEALSVKELMPTARCVTLPVPEVKTILENCLMEIFPEAYRPQEGGPLQKEVDRLRVVLQHLRPVDDLPSSGMWTEVDLGKVRKIIDAALQPVPENLSFPPELEISLPLAMKPIGIENDPRLVGPGPVSPGRIVNYYRTDHHGGVQGPWPAMVTRVDDEATQAVSLHVFRPPCAPHDVCHHGWKITELAKEGLPSHEFEAVQVRYSAEPQHNTWSWPSRRG